MPTKLVELTDGLLVDVKSQEDAIQQISAQSSDKVDRAFLVEQNV